MTIWTVSKDRDGYRLDAADLVMPALSARQGSLRQRTSVGHGHAQSDWQLRYVYFRPDRITLPAISLPAIKLTPDMGWCDDPHHAHYNMPVERPFAASHERLWREDGLYDVIVVLGHNDSPPKPFLGSAVFFHLREQHTAFTAGCVAVTRDDMMALLETADTTTILRIAGDGHKEAAR